ncbi:MAG: methylmalonyl-CoA epimerase [Chloroflexota bacterium]|nr:methylmalonyl-CoA epimerase [Chloroflexota bacterium]
MHIDHIALAVQDLDETLAFYRDALGVELTERRAVPAEGVEIAFLPLGEAKLELLCPLTAESNMARFIQKRGEGIHHLCIKVEDIEAKIAQLKEHGARMATEIRSHPDGTRYAFVHPKSTHGVLMELYQQPET